MSENTQNQNPKQEQYSLNDDRRVKVLSPGALVAKRFFRNRLAVVGLSILVAMFLFSFVGGVVSPYGQDEQFFTYTQMSKEFVGVTRNDTMRFVVADGQNFGSIAQSKALEAVKKGNTEFNYKDVDYTVDIQSDDFYVVYQGRDIMGFASRDLVNEADGAPKFSFDVKLAALTAMTAGEKEFAADGVDYTFDADGNILMGGISGYFGGWIDNIIMRVVDVFYCIPSMPVIIIIGAAMDAMRVDSWKRMMYLMLILGFLGWPSIARLVRGQILSLREQEFMLATEACGI